MDEEGAQIQKKLKYPKSVFFIVSNEFCERFAFYGMRTVLSLYLHSILKYSENTSTVIYHAFLMLAYLTSLFGAILADSLLGKFNTIFYVSIIYAVGQLLLFASATPWLNFGPRELAITGLMLVALGTGGIKPCVSAFGGDQFILPQQEAHLSTFFSFFYFAINSGSLISSSITPIFRDDIHCFGEKSCYPLAFFVPVVLMVVSIVLFLLGKPLYRIKEPEGNVVLNVTKCITHAIRKKIATSKKHKRDHWLDYADDKYSSKMIQDVKDTMGVLKLFLPLPIFWALYDQQGSRWTFQAANMNGEIGSFVIKPDQMQAVNPLLILVFIPLFNGCLYPLFRKLHIINTPLKKLTLGGLLAACAFILSALVEFKIEDTYAALPKNGSAQLRIFNTLNCTVPMVVDNETITLNPLNFWKNENIKAEGSVNIRFEAKFASCHREGYSTETGVKTGIIKVTEAEATTWVITRTGLDFNYIDSVKKSETKDFRVRALVSVQDADNVTLKLVQDSKTELEFNFSKNFNSTELKELKTGIYDIYMNEMPVQKSVNLEKVGVYTIVGYFSNKVKAVNVLTISPESSVHMLWLLPQIIVVTMGEVMFSVTGLEFAFTQAPTSMKSLLQAAWLLTVAFGNIIVIIIAETSLMKQSYEFLLFAGLMVLDMMIFALMGTFYKYVVTPGKETEGNEVPMHRKSGSENSSFVDDNGVYR